LANLNYSNISGNLIADVDYINTYNSFWLAEPALTIQAGPENVKFQLQLQYSYNLTYPDFIQDYTLVSLGLKVNLNPKKS
jgi:hypothetical protein